MNDSLHGQAGSQSAGFSERLKGQRQQKTEVPETGQGVLPLLYRYWNSESKETAVSILL